MIWFNFCFIYWCKISCWNIYQKWYSLFLLQDVFLNTRLPLFHKKKENQSIVSGRNWAENEWTEKSTVGWLGGVLLPSIFFLLSSISYYFNFFFSLNFFLPYKCFLPFFIFICLSLLLFPCFYSSYFYHQYLLPIPSSFLLFFLPYFLSFTHPSFLSLIPPYLSFFLISCMVQSFS